MSIINQVEAAAKQIEIARVRLGQQMAAMSPISPERAELDAIDAILFDVWVALGN